jgi:hypothetical protein
LRTVVDVTAAAAAFNVIDDSYDSNDVMLMTRGVKKKLSP